MKKKITAAAAVLAACLAMTTTISAVGMNTPTASQTAPAQQQKLISMGSRSDITNGCLMISEPGSYILTGEMQGTVLVDPGYGEVEITLDGAYIDGQNGPAIAAASGSRLRINIAGGSTNYICGGSDENYGAVFYSDIPVEIAGEGRLDMVSTGRDVIRIKDNDIIFSGGDIRLSTHGYGIEAKNAFFNGGAVTFESVGAEFAPGTEVITDAGKDDEDAGTIILSSAGSGTVSVPTGTSGSGVTYSGSTGTVVTPSVSTGTVVAPSGNTGTVVTPSGSTGTVVAPSGNTGTVVTPSGSTGTVVAPSGSTGTVVAPSGNTGTGAAPSGNNGGQFSGGQQGTSAQNISDTAGEVVEGITENSAMELTADYDNATSYDVSESSEIKITSSGTYIVTGSAEEGSITVKKGTTGVVLVLQDLDLSSSSGAVLSINKQAEVQVIISGTVNLTDNEDPADENSADAEIADAFDGAAIKVKAESVVFITGDGTLNIKGNAKNGIKAGDDSSLIIGGDIDINIEAVNDGINSNYDFTILSGDVDITAGDDGIHADHILTIGDNGTGPVLTIKNSTEGLEGTVVNIAGGTVSVNATDDGINAANGDGVYEGILDYSINITGGNITVKAGTDGLDSNGNINLINGSLTISSANNGGDAGIDYDGQYYVDPAFILNNSSGVAGPDMMPGQMGGQMPGQMGGQMPGQMGGQMPGQMGGFGR